LAALCSSASAAAYCRTTTCDSRKEDCGDAETGCPSRGIPLFWGKRCTSFSVQKDGSAKQGIDYDTTLEIISIGFNAWRGADCGGGVRPSLDIAVTEAVSCAAQEYNDGGGNANIWMYRDDNWPYAGTNETLALTTLTFNTKTGEIYDADVEINAHDKNITVSDTDVRADLQSIVTHEAGHFLGLAHSSVPDATMQASYNPGQTNMRTLSADDIDGICRIYPPDRRVQSGDCEPRRGFSSRCGGNPSDEGCNAGAHAAGTSSTGYLSLGGLLACALALRVRSRRRISRAD
jgi:hypothetical protein